MIGKKIIFKKPDFKNLDKNYCYVDMHHHSNYSDTTTKVSSIIKKAKKNGFGVAVTDHNLVKGSIEAFKNKKGVFVVPGVEVSSMEGPHLLVYFYNIRELEEFFEKHIKNKICGNPFIRTKIKFDDLVEHTKRYNCVTCLAHPIDVRHLNLISRVAIGKISPEALKDVDAVEVFCGRITRKMNITAIGLCEIMGKAYTGGGDGHALFDLGSVLTYSKTDSLNDFLDAIKKKKNYIIGNESRIASYSKQAYVYLKDLRGYFRSHYEMIKMLREEKKSGKGLG
ncbi:PHP domain-containing protein [Candidatus Woesearchaeota archaeon]|nr:PHP domain-containing protein [Candidatus Woesearchaeota archaeon]